MVDVDTLVIFDVDHVLLQPKDQLLSRHYIEKFRDFCKKSETRLNTVQILELYTSMLMQRAFEPVDKRFIQLIDNIQTNRVKALALTHCRTGQWGKISSMEDWRIKDLKHLGYYFDKSWNNIENKLFDYLPSNSSRIFPAFKQGIVFTGEGFHKGEALKAFLNYTDLQFEKILFVDDKREYLESVAKFAREASIEFLGIEYTAVEDSKIEPLNKERVKLQLDVLEKEYKWLSDEEADLQINKKPLKN